MEWLKDLLRSLPLESISEVLARVVLWWTHVVDGVPEEQLALHTYVGGSVLVLILLYWVLKLVPRFMRGMIWIVSAAILLTPGTTIGDTGGSAPAIIDVLHSLLMGEPSLAILAFLPILAVIIVGLILGAMWKFVYAFVVSRASHQP